MNKLLLTISFCLAFAISAFARPASSSFSTLRIGDYTLKVSFVKADVVRVQWVHGSTFAEADNEICVQHGCEQTKIATRNKDGFVAMTSDSLAIIINKQTGAITYRDRKKGNIILAENASSPHVGEKIYVEKITYDESTRRTVKTADGEKEVADVMSRDTVSSTWKWLLNLTLQQGEAVYGLGSHMEDYMNLRGKTMYLCQHNLKEMVPVINSTAGYGLLINSGSEMIFSDNNGNATFTIEAAPQLDYYFMKGWNMDATVKNYRWLTGEAPLMPLYVFGYIQSKERYVSSDDLIGTLRQFRQRHIPIDMIVQDWCYWEPSCWGHMKMNSRDYPDKRALTDAIHGMNAKLMISIWPNTSNSSQEKDFQQRGMMIPGTNVYNAFMPEARDLYWQYANNEFFSNGFDAWWCDSTEPLDADWCTKEDSYTWDSHAERFELCSKRLGDALEHHRSQLFSLYHSKGIYEHQRLTTDKKRVVNLTRSSYAGQQRYSTIVWNGDTHASWQSFAKMIPAGLNYVSTGCPYWTVDAGTFFVKKGWAWFYNGDYEQGCNDLGFREFYVRMLQYATFLPVMRSHGTDTPREPWRFGDSDSPFYQAILDCIKLRYSLLPYTYSLAANVTFDAGTMMRPLAFDYASDANVLDIKDQYLFGKNLLIAPVTTPMYYAPGSTPINDAPKQRKVYLPDNGSVWYDFYTNAKHNGGQTIVADADIKHIPVFVPAGSILPLCQGNIEHTGQYDKMPWEIRIYPGKNASFTIYQDAGDGYDYENGETSSYTLHWNDKRRILTISKRNGNYMPSASQTLIITTPDGKRMKTTYYGKKMTIKL